MLLMGGEWFCSQFCSHFMVVVLAVQAILLKDVEAKEMAKPSPQISGSSAFVVLSIL
jgi:hypothetical protein